MSNDQQRPFPPEDSGRPVPPPTPEGGWGGEHEGDATAFIQLPEDLPGPYRHGYDDGSGGPPDPLAAPGTGQGWTPPAIDPQAYRTPGSDREQVPVTPVAGTDPAAPGQWTMPFASTPADVAPAPAPEPAHAPASEPARGAEQDAAHGHSQPSGMTAALGQGAAAALAGSHEARERQRRPLGEGPTDPARPARAQADEQPPRPQEPSPPKPAPDQAHGGAPRPSGTDWSAVPAPGATGQWSIPFAAAGSPDDSGEYLAPASTGRFPEPPAPGEAEPVPRPAHRQEDRGGEDTAGPDREETSPAAASGEARGPAPDEHRTPPEGPEAVPEPAAGRSVPETASEPAADPTAERPREHVDLPEPPAPEAPAADAPVPEPAAVDSEHPHVSYTLRVNGVERPVTDAWIGESLLYVLRERLGLAGAKDGCSQGECGACSVQVDGRLVASCLVPAATTAGSEVRTVEGLAGDAGNGTPSDVQRALAACGAVQCGFCVPGMAMTLHDLLEGNHAPTELEIRRAVSGNLCRCSGYRGVLDAVRAVVTEREAAAEAREAEARGTGDDTGGAGSGGGTGDAGSHGDARIRIPQQSGPVSGGTHHDHHLPQDGGAQ
ncbi:2Fe-2S iron-sulfur cluster binding domain-containing protein [Streptomyces sp. TRM43335]|uniref:2Fe-2S iron-sulfur cluster binding domain-containing protein n=1 Tax=Streptomyces taklimakanensis TaxID=2569853 RepID=A0A6G2BB03_9ACTN|nr:(2Fe-2S)-binding protein [Streptomyces taklimakanensis]MTE19243.1 2Fe-2S iron-sulfur cluster binding domain-containing protein [Streptomyces taklimakanensis]